MSNETTMTLLMKNTGKLTIQVHINGCPALNRAKRTDTKVAYETGMAEEIQAEQGIKVSFCKCCKQ